LIIEGLNVLQVGSATNDFVSDYFDFSIYIDAIETDIENWFIERFQTLRKTIFQDPDSFFKHFADFTEEQAIALAHEIWAGINGKNLKENIEPTRSRASLVLHKGADHKVNAVHLRKL
jgi:type I pantothenate kinase